MVRHEGMAAGAAGAHVAEEAEGDERNPEIEDGVLDGLAEG